MVNSEEFGYTRKQLIEKYGKNMTRKILSSDVFYGATIGINENNEEVYYFIDVKIAIKKIKGIKTLYFD